MNKRVVFLAVACLLFVCGLCFAVYGEDTSQFVAYETAYEFFSSFMPSDDLTQGENGSLLWEPPWGYGGPRELKFCNELVFPDTEQPRQNTYQISFRSDSLDALVMYFDITDDKGENLLPQSTYESELSQYRVYLLKYIDGAWYWAYDATDYRWEHIGQEEIAPALLCGQVDPDKYDLDYQHYPLPSGRYALALCDELETFVPGSETAECYGLVEFDLICRTRQKEYSPSRLSPPDSFYWNMPIEYKIENAGETIYFDPSKR